MHGKHILVIACSGFLTAGMGSALAVEDAAADGYQENSYQESSTGSDMDTSQATQNQTWSDSGKASDDAMANRGGMSQDDVATSQTGAAATAVTAAKAGQAQSDSAHASGTDMAGKAAHNRQGEQIGRVVGTLVDESGRVQGYVVRTGEADANGANEYVVVPQEDARAATGQSSDTASMARSRAAGEDSRSAGMTERRRMLERMYQQLQKQALEIRLLRQQLAMQNGMGRGSGQAGNAQDNPLNQVAQVVVDRFGRVQAVVLESGIVLASDQLAGGASLD